MTEDDKELLRLAAKAYWGDEIDDVVSIELSEYENAILYMHPDNQDHNGKDVAMRWNPLEEDGDAFGLAAKLNIFPEVDDEMGWVTVVIGIQQILQQKIRGDVLDACRIVITRAAAEIGRKMP